MIQLLRRFMHRYFSPQMIRNYSGKFVNLPSALYVGGEHKSTVFTSLDPHIDPIQSFKNINKLKSDLEARNICVDVDFLYEQSKLYSKVIEIISMTKKDISRLKSDLRIASDSQEDQTVNNTAVSVINEKLNEARSLLEAANEEMIALEKTFIIPFLQLPNSLHKTTTTYNECLFSLFPIPQFTFTPRSHADIGRVRDEIEFADVSPTSYYFKGNVALLEMAVSEFIMSRFREHGFKNFANMDIAKAVLAEGCGYNLRSNKYFQIDDDDCLAFNQIQFLFGSSSLPSFVALFCKGVINFVGDDTPFRLVSSGRKYSMDREDSKEDPKPNSLFNCLQSTCISGFVVYPNETGDEEAVVNEIAMLLSQLYTELGLHFKLIQYGASKLRSYESLAVGVCMYSPYLDRYIETGRISLCQDFISKRLQIYQGLGKKYATFLGMIYIEVLDVRNWIGCMIENTQTPDGKYVIPSCLQPFMYGVT